MLSGDDIVGGNITIGGKLNSTASSTFTIDFYASSSADASGYGEGQRYLGSTTATTNGSGNIVFAATLAASVSAGEFITATATDASGNTSEFLESQNRHGLLFDSRHRQRYIGRYHYLDRCAAGEPRRRRIHLAA